MINVIAEYCSENRLAVREAWLRAVYGGGAGTGERQLALALTLALAHRETTAHWHLTALGLPVPAQQHCDSFRYRRAAFYNGLKSKVGLAAAKAAALRVNLNINGCSIVAPPARSSRSSRACLTDSVLSHSLPMPHVH
eukprot:GHVU01030904.1.p3 GENE.GHVU01030904.1~~GHVU01030904.1.p3  ORF type:complete len:138 (+),score=12.23 GHVU01030904.1:431-844(+)